MRLLLDMNLSPQWRDVLAQHGYPSVHWSDVGPPEASDRAIMEWASKNGYVVITHDLDFGTILAATRGRSPSVVQIRAQDVMPASFAPLLVRALTECEAAISEGALVVVDQLRLRARILPLLS